MVVLALISLVAFVVLLIALPSAYKRLQPEIPWQAIRDVYPALVTLAVAFTSFVLYGTLYPFEVAQQTVPGALRAVASLPLIPADPPVADLVSNFLLMAPAGFFWLAVLTMGYRNRKIWLLGCLAILTGGFCLSSLSEFLQFWVVSRIASKTDVLLQTCGLIAGMSLWTLVGQAVSQWLAVKLRNRRPRNLLDGVLEFYVISVFFISFVPFEVSIEVSDLGRKYFAGNVELTPQFSMSPTFDRLVTAALMAAAYLPVGVLVCIWQTSRENRVRSPLRSAWISLWIVIAYEVIRIMIPSSPVSVTRLLLGCGGVLVGVGVVTFFSRARITARTDFWILAATLTILALPAVAWAPYDFTLDRQLIREHLASFRSFEKLEPLAQFRSDGWTLLLLAVLGCLFARAAAVLDQPRVIRNAALVFGAGLLAGVAVVLEVGQVLLTASVGRVVEVPSLFLAGLLGMVAGSVVFRVRAGTR